jgi:streptogramin lyase
VPVAALTGVVKAGPAPVAGASVQIFAAGTTGNGSAPVELFSTPFVTDANGAFSVPAFTCSLSNSVLYARASGGASANDGVALAAVLGTCGDLASGGTFTINEATTVAMAWSMSQFLSSAKAGGMTQLGASATNGNGIAMAAATAANLVDSATGVVPGSQLPATGTSPIAKINTLANVLNACIISSGAGSPACTQLYAGAGSAADTLDAAVSIVKHPGTNVASIYTLSKASGAYMPVVASAPPDWTLAVNFTGGGMNGPSAVSIDSTGKVWVANYFSVASYFTNIGKPVFPTGIVGNHLLNSFGGAVDVNDDFWIANEESGDVYNNGLGSISVLNNTGGLDGHYYTGGINFPLAVAFDTSGVSWVVDYGDSSITLLDATGNPLSGTNGYSAANLLFPVAVATDAKCNAYVANQSGNTVTRVLADGSAFTDFTVGEAPSGVAIDVAGNIWSANYYGDSVGLISSAGTVLSGTGYTGGGLDHPQGIAIDGGGSVWVANYRAPAITELAGATTASPGAFLSPAAGYAPDSGLSEAFGAAIDASGNLWVTSFGSNTLTEFVGLAVPVQTPLLGPLRVP